jgi:hypothetical protein
MLYFGEYRSDYGYIINVNKYNPIRISSVYALSYICCSQAYAFVVLRINCTAFEGETLPRPTIAPKPEPCLGASVCHTLNKILTLCVT